MLCERAAHTTGSVSICCVNVLQVRFQFGVRMSLDPDPESTQSPKLTAAGASACSLQVTCRIGEKELLAGCYADSSVQLLDIQVLLTATISLSNATISL